MIVATFSCTYIVQSFLQQKTPLCRVLNNFRIEGTFQRISGREYTSINLIMLTGKLQICNVHSGGFFCIIFYILCSTTSLTSIESINMRFDHFRSCLTKCFVYTYVYVIFGVYLIVLKPKSSQSADTYHRFLSTIRMLLCFIRRNSMFRIEQATQIIWIDKTGINSMNRDTSEQK